MKPELVQYGGGMEAAIKASQSQYQYYTNTSGQGDYQFTTLDNIIIAFMIGYVGEGKLISKVNRTDVQFHAMRAIQELSYDVFRSIKSQEIEVPATLKMVLPQDYVNYVKVVRVGSDGIERILYPTGKTSNPFAITQDTSGNYLYDDSNLNLKEQTPSDMLEKYQAQETTDPYIDDTVDIEIENRGRRYGLDPQYAQSNGTFFI